MLWRDESSLSAQHIKIGLQFEIIEGKEGRKPWESWITEEKRVNSKQQISEPKKAVWERRSEIQRCKQKPDHRLQEDKQTI